MKPFSVSLMQAGKIVRWRGAGPLTVGDVVHELAHADIKWDRIEVEEVPSRLRLNAEKLQDYFDNRWT